MQPLPFTAAVARRLTRVLVLDGASRAVVVAVVGGVVAVAVDWQWHLPGTVRLALLGGVVAGAGAVAAARVLKPLRRSWTAAEIARLVERAEPTLGGRLSTAVAGIDLGPVESARLDLVLQDALVRRLVPATRLPRNLGLALAALVSVGGASVMAPGIVADGVVRLLAPLGVREWTRFTVVEAAFERSVAPVDEGLALRIERRHPDPAFAAPVVVAQGLEGERRLLPGVTGSRWTHAIQAPAGPVSVMVTSGDAVPVALSGQLVPRPALDRLEATVVPPPYTGLPTTTAPALGSGVPQDATVTVRLQLGAPERPAVLAEVRWAGQTLAVTPQEPGWFTVTFTAQASGDLVVDGADADGIRPVAPVRLPVGVVPDRVPTCSLAGPAPREAVTPQARIPVRIEAADDLGLARLSLRADGPGASRQLLSTEVTGLAVTRVVEIRPGDHAAPGESLNLMATVADHRPGTGQSEPLQLRVATEEQVRQDLDRLVAEARDRVVLAREQLAQAGVAAARPPQERATEVLAQVVRRWRENGFDATALEPVVAARTTLADEAAPALAREDRSAADLALATAERQLAALLGEGDLTRRLTSLITRQQALAEETRGFVRSTLTKPLDAAGRETQQALVQRQADLAAQVAEAQRQVLAQEGASWKEPQALVRREDPAERLRNAVQALASTDRRTAAPVAQQQAVAALQKLLDALKGGDAAQDLAQRIGKAAAEQERLSGAIDRGEPGTEARQREAQREVERLAQEAARPDAEVAKRLQAAAASQQGAAEALSRGDASTAGAEAAAAAALLREAQQRLGGQEPPPSPSGTPSPDVLAALKALAQAQATIVTDATLLDRTLGEAEPDFATTRQLALLAEAQQAVGLRLEDEVIRRLAKHPIAALAVERIAAAVADSHGHLATPALGAQGVRLTRLALAEMQRLLAMSEAPPGGGSGGSAGGGGRCPQAAFPPTAELALLAALQAELTERTAAGVPIDLAVQQARLRDLTQALGTALRPTTRPAVLVGRARRAMASAAWRLEQGDRGLTTRHEQEAAEAVLRRLLAEAGGDSGGGSSGGGGGSQPQPPSTAGASGSGAGGGGAGGSGTPAPAGQGGPGPAVLAEDGGVWMHLPPERRAQLKEARSQALTPRQLQIYGRYLELLEGK